MIRLEAAAEELPLGFQVADTLSGDKPPFRAVGMGALAGPELDNALAREGVGLKTITISASYSEYSGQARLLDYTDTLETAGTLDAQTLAGFVYAHARQLIQNQKNAKKGTPPEIFVKSITIGQPGEPELEPEPDEEETETPKRKPKRPESPPEPRRPRKRVTRYRDTLTGHFVKQATWKRSRARLKKGKRGRYVRVRTWE